MDGIAIAVVGGAFIVALGFVLGLGFGLRRRGPATDRVRPSFGSAADARSLRTFVTPHRSPLNVAVALILMTIVLDLAAPWPFKVMVDNAIGGDPLPGWLSSLDGLSRSTLALVAAIAGVAIVMVAALIGYLIEYLTGAAEVRIGADMRAAAFERLQSLSLRFHDRNRSGDLVSRLLDDVSRVAEVLVSWLDTVIPEALTLAGMLVIMLLIDVPLTLAALTVVPILIWYAVRSHPIIRDAEREAIDLEGDVAAQATDLLRNVRAVQAFSREREEGERFRHQSDIAADADIEALDVTARYTPLAGLALAAGAGLVSWLGVVQVINGSISLGTMLVILTYLGSLYDPIRSLVRLVSNFAKAAASRDRILELFADEHTVKEHPEAVKAPYGSPGLVISDVSFAYDQAMPVLENLSFDVKPRQTVCLVGPTGVGKSTFLSLLLRLYEADTGTIELGGIDIAQIELRSLRNRIALVPQDPWMIDGTIAENIAFGRAQTTEPAIREAARLAFLDDFIDLLPDGFDTVVGESGELLSGGQRRRIALARALLRDASVLLLDEPTSGLDAAAEAKVMEAIAATSLGRTTVMVSHRLNVARAADWVIVLGDGHVEEQGTHASLLALDGRYAELWRLQRRTASQTGVTSIDDRRVAREGSNEAEGEEVI